MTYTSDEIDGKVGSLVQGSPSFKRDGLGGRNVKERFQEMRELVDSVLLYEPDSLYYLIYKATIRLRQSLTSLLSTMDSLSSDINEMSIPARPIQDTTGFSDATNALATISSALSRRGSISAAEYNKYDRAVTRVLTKYSESVKRTYTPFGASQAVTDIVRSSAEAVSSLSTNFASFSSSYASLLASVDRLLEASNDYDHKEVVRAVASRQMSRIKSEMEALESAFNGSTPTERTKTARDDVLAVIANRSTVKALANIRYPGDTKIEQPSTGPSLYRISSYGTGTAPTITGSVSGPWPVLDAHELAIDFNSTDPTVVVPLVPTASSVPGIRAATITGANAEYTGISFAINEDLDTPWPLLSREISTGTTYAISGKFMYLIVDGVSLKISDALPGGFSGALGVTAVANAINSVAGSYVTATGVVGASVDYVSIAYKPPATQPELYRNRYMQIATGPDDASSLGSWRVDVNGSPDAGDLSTGWDGNDEFWIWPNDLTEPTVLGGQVKVDLPNGTWPSYVVTAVDVRDAINGATAEVVASVDSGRIVLTSADSGEGSIVRITAEDYSTKKSVSYLGMETLGFFEGQESREHDVSAQAIVEVLNDNSDFSSNAVAELIKETVFSSKKAYGDGAATLSVDLAEDPRSSWDVLEMKLIVGSGENAGVYGVSSASYSASKLSLVLNRNLRAPSDTGLRIELYKELLKITATSSSTTSYIDVDQAHANTAHTVLGLPEALTRGTVEQLLVQYNHPIRGWVTADLTGYGIKVGDVVLQEDGTPITTVTGVDSISSGVLDVAPVDPTLVSTSFSVQSVSADNHSSFISSLSSWRSSFTSDEENLTSLTGSINFLVLNKNPPKGRVQAASNDLQAIRTLLEGTTALSGILESFTVPSVPAVDRALQVMTENGHDRARDLITDAKFSDYQATNYKTASRSGAMMDAAAKVAVNDLVEPTKTRPEFIGEISRLVSTTFDEIDPKYDFRDMRSGSSPINLDYFSAKLPSEK